MKLFILLMLISTTASAVDCRSVTARNEFWRSSGFQHGRPGFWVDHVCPLECGGKDDKINMQWQTKSGAMAKDRWELNKCAELCNLTNSTYPIRTVFNCKRGN